MLSGLDLLKETDIQPAKTGLDLSRGIAPAEGDAQVKTGLALLGQPVVTKAPTTEVPMEPSVHPATAYLEKFAKPSIEEFDRYQPGPLISDEGVVASMDTLGRLWNLAQHPYDVIKGAAVFASEIPGFIGGLASAVGQIPIEILKGGSVLDWYNASARNMQTISGLWHRGVSEPLGKLLETPERMGEELALTMFGAEPKPHKTEAEMVGEIFMVPYTAVAAPLHGMADSPTWDDHPNIRGILKFGADALGLITMGLVLKGGPVMAARKVDPIVKKAHDIDGREKAIEASGLDEVLKTAQKKILDVEKGQLELEIKRLKKELDHEKLAKEDLKGKGKEVEAVKEGIEVEAIREERLKFARERIAVPEEKVKTGIKLIKRVPPKLTEPITDVDLQTGTKEPAKLSTEDSPFRETPERTQMMKEIYEERAEGVRSEPELFTNKLLNDVNRWLDGEDLPIEEARNTLSELAARSDELRRTFLNPSDFQRWKDTVSSAATWARKADRLKIEQPLPSVDLNMMVPVSKVSEAVMDVLGKVKGLKFGDIYRNKEVFDKTGLWIGKDGFWRYEIDDSKAELRKFISADVKWSGKLSEILDYPELYKNFPGIKDMDVRVDPSKRPGSATYYPDKNRIVLSESNKSILLHELQHTVNRNMGAFQGTSTIYESAKILAKRLRTIVPKVTDDTIRQELRKVIDEFDNRGHSPEFHTKVIPFLDRNKDRIGLSEKDIDTLMFPTGAREAYMRAPGEMEARLTEMRREMTAEERRATPPWESLDWMLRDEERPVYPGATLYSGLPIGEAVKQLKEMAKHTAEFMKEFRGSFKEKEFDFSHVTKQMKADTLRSLWDQSETLLNMVKNRYPEEYERIVTRQRSAVTGIGYGKVLYGQAVKEVYGGKSKEMIEAVNAYVLARRFKDIYGYRLEKGYKHQPGYGATQATSVSTMIEMIKDVPPDAWGELSAKVPEIKKLFGELTPSEMADVVKAGDAYFEWSRKIVDDLVEAGIKSPEEGALLKAHDFRKFKTVLIRKLYDFNYDLQLKGETVKVSNSGVLELGAGSTKIIEPDSRVVLSEQMARAYGSIAHQAAVLEWKALADRHPDNGFVSVKKQSGWSPIPYMEDGARKNIYFHPDTVKYLVTRSRDMSPRLAMVLRSITMAPVTRALAVGLSPVWSTLAGLPMDVMHSLWAARTWEVDAKGVRPKASFPFYETKTGKFKKVYSPFAGVDALQIGLDMKRTIRDVYSRGPLTENLMRHGLVMNFLTQRQNRYMKGVKPPGDWAKTMDLLSYHGLSMELWARVATANRVIRRSAKERGITYEQALKNDDIMYRAAHAGRDRMDYNQGGWFVKALDQSGIIFLNAAVLGTRTFWRQAVDNPVDFAFKTAQLGLTAAGLTAAAWSLYPEVMKDMSEKGNKRDVTWPIAPDWLKIKDRDGDDISFYFKLRMDPNAAFLYRIFEGLTRTYMYDQGLTKEEPDYRELVKTLKHLGPVDIKLQPALQAWVDYTANYSWWKDRQMYTQMGGKTLSWPESQYEGMFDETVPQMAKDIAGVTKLSPKRLAGTVSNVIPRNNEFVWLMGSAYEEAFSDVPEEVRKQHWLITLAETPGFNKVIGITRHGQGRWKVKSDIENEIDLKRMVRNSKFDMLATQNAWYGVKNKDELFKFMKEQEHDIYTGMVDKLKFIKDPVIKSLPHRDFWLSMRHMSVEGRAKTWTKLLERSNESEKAQLLNELNQVMLVGGIVTPEFMEEVNRPKLGNEQSIPKESSIDMLKRHEGLRMERYKDTKKKPTIGYGHLIKPGENLTKITKDEAEKILLVDMKIAEETVNRLPKKFLDNLNSHRKNVLINMAFTLGGTGLRGFVDMFDAIGQRNFDLAAKEILDSDYAEDVGYRANELAEIMQRGY